MYSVKRSNIYQFLTISYFLLGSIVIGFITDLLNLDLPVAVSLAISQLGLVLVPVVVYKIVTKSPIKATFHFQPIDIVNVFLLFGIGFMMLPTLSLINIISQLFVKNYIADTMIEMTNLPILLSLLLIGVFPAVFEELSARAIIVSNYRDMPIRTTCIMSGLFFGMLHMNLNQFSYAFAMGAILCLVVHITGSIYASMIIHFTVNATMLLYQNFIFKILNGFGDASEIMTASTDFSPITLIPAILLFVLINCFTIPITYMLIKLLAHYNEKGDLMKSNAFTKQFLRLNPDSESLILKPVRQKILTLPLIGTISIFVIFVTIEEIILPFFQR